MKLLSNSDFDSVLAYFPGVDYPDGGTLENPAVYRFVCDENGRVPLRFNGWAFPFYLLFMANGETDYVANVSSSPIEFKAYDYLNFEHEKAERGEGELFSGTVEPGTEGGGLRFRLSGPGIILARLQLSSWIYYDPSVVPLFSILPRPPVFGYDAHWIRDWSHRINGTSWDRNGKLGKAKSLSEFASDI